MKHVTVTYRQTTVLKQEIASRKTYPGCSQQSSVIRGHERTRSFCLGLHCNTANVNLLTFSHNSAVADAQAARWADEINLVGHISSFSRLFFKILSSAPRVLNAFILELLTEKMICPGRPSHACPFCAPQKASRQNRAHMTDRVWPQRLQNSCFSVSLQLTQKRRIHRTLLIFKFILFCFSHGQMFR